jgi:peptidoglycan/xylan/chitin deacetylase (PgdA/CDA1 family)
MTTPPLRVEIPAFPGGKRIAVTTSWDDGNVYDRWVIDALNQLRMKGTFNLNSGLLTRTGVARPTSDGGYLDASEVAALYAGHEVAVHTATHPWLTRLTATQIIDEVLDDRKALEELVDYPVRGMAYPFGNYDPRVIALLRDLGIVYSRTTAADVYDFPPSEPLAWGTTMHFLSEQPAPLPERWAAFYQQPNQRGLFYLWGHSYELSGADDALQRLTPLAHKPDVWYCTNSALFEYEAARQRLVIAANKRSCYNPSACDVTIALDGALRDVPLGVTTLDKEKRVKSKE